MRKVAARYVCQVAALFPLLWFLVSGATYLHSISKCDGTFSPANSYIAYCLDREGFGDFEHSAFLYGLAGTKEALAHAKVLFLGNSKVQYAFSRPNVGAFFGDRGTRFLLMGFGYNEDARFAKMVLQRHPAQPTVAIINVDLFFTSFLSQPGTFLEDHPIAGFVDALLKLGTQRLRARACRPDIPQSLQTLLCRGRATVMRSEVSGEWSTSNWAAEPEKTIPVPPTVLVSEEEVRQWLLQAGPMAVDFLKLLNARCVVFTSIPSATSSLYARRLASHVGGYFINPQLDGLTTIDSNHLDTKSSIRWSEAFLRELDPVGRSCGAW